MNKRTQTQKMVDSVVETVKEDAADIMELLPGVGKVMSQVMKSAQKVNEKVKDTTPPPTYMKSVKFCCKKNKGISEQQHRELEMIFTNEYKSFENKNLEDIESFIDTYVGRDMDTGEVFDYAITEDHLWIHLNESERFLYDGECLQKTLNALNALLREEVFERFEVLGNEEDYYDD